MKRFRGVFVFMVVFLITVPSKPALAGCRVASGNACSAGTYIRDFTLEFLNDPGGGGTNHTIDPQCTSPVGGNGTSYTVCCDTPTEANSFDSVRAPLCGSSIEKGKDNSVCWGCGGYIYCSGADFTLAGTDPILDQYRQEGFRVLTQTEMAELRAYAASQGRPERFIFNGVEYPLTQNIAEIGICSANLTACLVPNQTECINLAYKDNQQPVLGESGTVKPEPRRESDPSRRAGSRESGLTTRQQVILANPGLQPGEPMSTSKGLSFLNKLGIDVHQLFARIRYGNNERGESTFESFPDIRRFAATLDQSGSQDLMTSVHQKSFSPPDEGDKVGMYPLKGMAGYRFCAPGSTIKESGKDNIPLAGLTATRGNIGSNDPVNPRAWPQLVWSSQYLASLTTRAKTEGADFITPGGSMVPYERIQEGDGEDAVFLNVNPEVLDPVLYPCAAATDGTPMARTQTEAEGEAKIRGAGGILSRITASFQRAFFAGSLIPCNEHDKEGNCTETRLYLLPTDSIAALPAVTCQTIGCNLSQLSEGMPSADREKMVNDGGGDSTKQNPEGQKGGFVRSFMPGRYVKNIDYINAKTPQRQQLSFESEARQEPRAAYPLWMRSVIDGLSCVVDSAIVPSKLKRPGAWCRYSQGEGEPYPGTADRGIAAWTLATTLPPDFTSAYFQTSVKDAITSATKGQIPQCVLEGVKFIESGPEWFGGSTCLINQCSAAGPFAITVGQDASGDTRCRQCGESWKDGSRPCPDAWEYDWPPGDQSKSPCNLTLSAEKAVNILIAKSQYWTETMGMGHTLDTSDPASQKEGIILAGNSYVGSSQTWSHLGGCSYGEFVYKHCNPIYQCGTGNIKFPHEQQ